MANWSNEIIEVLKTYSGQSVTAQRRPMKLIDIRNKIVLKYNPNTSVSEIKPED